MAKNGFVNLWTSGPIDYWSGMIDLTRFQVRDFAMEFEDADAFQAEVDALFEVAKKLASKAGWEGDISQGPFLGTIPNADAAPQLIIGWKQRNNGSCFIASNGMLVGHGFGGVPVEQGKY